MINPQHPCWWAHNRLTQLDLISDAIWATDINLQVLISALHENDLVWYSLVFGDFDDNVVMIATEKHLEAPGFRVTHPDSKGATVTKYIGDLYPVTEYLITDEVASAYDLSHLPDSQGFRLPDASSNQTPPKWRYMVYSHDECFTSIRPANNKTLALVIDHVLRLHDYFLGQEFKWSTVGEDVARLLNQHLSLRLNSIPGSDRQGPRVEVQLPVRPWVKKIWPGLEFRRGGVVTFKDGIATLSMTK
jgi:hypothetical protein